MHQIRANGLQNIEPYQPFSNHLTTQEMDTVSMTGMRGVPAHERAGVLRNATLLFTREMGDVQKSNIVEAVVRIPDKEREGVIALVLEVVSDDMDEYSRIKILEAIMRVSAHERAGVIRNAVPLFTSEMRYFERIRTIDIVASIPDKERDPVIAFVSQLITGKMDVDQRMDTLQAVMDIPPQERDEEVKRTVLLFKSEMGAVGRVRMIRGVTPSRSCNQMSFVTPLGSQAIAQGMNKVLSKLKMGSSERTAIIARATTEFLLQESRTALHDALEVASIARYVVDVVGAPKDMPK